MAQSLGSKMINKKTKSGEEYIRIRSGKGGYTFRRGRPKGKLRRSEKREFPMQILQSYKKMLQRYMIPRIGCSENKVP